MAGYHGTVPESGLEVSQPGLEHLQPQQKLTIYDNVHHEEGPAAYRAKTSRNPFGLSPLVFGIAIALVTSVVLGAALGGGLGSAIHSSSKEASCSASTTATLLSIVTTTTLLSTVTASSYSSPATPTTLLSNYTVPAPASIDSLSLPLGGCPTLSSQTYTSHQNDVFNFDCGVDYGGNDLMAFVAYSLYDCCDACSNMKIHLASPNRCVALTFQANLSQAYAHENPPGGANCFLKNASDAGTTGGIGPFLGAIMQSSQT